MKNLILILSCLLLFLHTSAKKVKTGFAEVNGTKLYYEVSGKGEPVLLIHGNGGDCRHWDFQFKVLSKKYKVIRYDVRGYGKSALPDPNKPYGDYQDLKSLMDTLEIEKGHICGISMGSGIAVDFALAFPDRCLSLISVGPWANGYGVGDYKTPACDSLYAVMAKVPSIAKEKGSKAATDYFLTGNEVFKQSLKNPKTIEHMKTVGYDYSFWGFINKSKRKGYRPNAITQLKQIKLPMLIVTAEDELGACAEIANIMEKEISGSKKIVIQEAGHCMSMDKPDEFNAELISFIESLK